MISLQRKSKWEQDLFDFMKSKINDPYEWGRNDCILFAADAVEVMTGHDFAAGRRGTYDGPIGAARIIREAGVEDVAEFVALHLPEISVASAGRGDVVICWGPDGDFAAICQGRSCVGPSARGLIHIDRAQVKRAFKVGA